MHRPFYVWGVKHYVGIEVERHGNVRKVLMGSFLAFVAYTPFPDFKLGDCCLLVSITLCLLERQNMQGMDSACVLK